MGYQDLKFSRTYEEPDATVWECTPAELDTYLKAQQKKQQRRATVGVILATAAGALGMYLWDSHEAAQTAAAAAQAVEAARTQAQHDSQQNIVAATKAGRKIGEEQGFAKGKQQGFEQGHSLGYQEGGEATEARLKIQISALAMQADQRVQQANRRTEEMKQRALRIITRQRQMLKIAPCYKGYNVDVSWFGASLKIGNSKGCRL